MSSTYVESIERFADSVDTSAIDNIVKYLGIALQSADGSTVAASDPDELKTIQDGVCAKKLGLDASEAEAAIQQVCEIMKHDAAKCRVTFYYLLADKAGKLEAFA
ncbi:MAG: DUF2853 family protein [Planctomycetota bacterium]